MTLTALIAFSFVNQDKIDPNETAKRLAVKLRSAKGLSYSVKSFNTKAGKTEPFMAITAKVRRPNLIFAESERQCWYSNGVENIEFYPLDKEYVKRPLDPTGMWLPMGTGLLDFCAPSIYKPNYQRGSYKQFEGKRTICLESDEPEVPGLILKIYLDPTTLVPAGWEQVTADSTLKAIYTKIDLGTEHPLEAFKWTPPKDAVDGATVKRVSTLLTIGATAPKLQLKDVNGKPITMEKLLNGKKGLLINFWYYGCGYCQKEFPHLKEFYAKAKKQGLEILLINSGNDSIPVIKTFLDKAKLTMPVGVNGKEAVKAYGVQSFPTNYVVDSSGKIIYRSRGFSEDEFKSLASAAEALCK